MGEENIDLTNINACICTLLQDFTESPRVQESSVTAAPERTCVALCSRTSPESAERTVAGNVSSERTRTEVGLQVIMLIHTERKRKQK